MTNLLECEVTLKSFIDFGTNVALNSTNWLLTVIVLSRTPSRWLRLHSLQLLFRSWISFVDYPIARFCLTHISLLLFSLFYQNEKLKVLFFIICESPSCVSQNNTEPDLFTVQYSNDSWTNFKTLQSELHLGLYDVSSDTKIVIFNWGHHLKFS